MPSLCEILTSKNLNPQLFDEKFDITEEMPIDQHAAWVYNNHALTSNLYSIKLRPRSQYS